MVGPPSWSATMPTMSRRWRPSVTASRAGRWCWIRVVAPQVRSPLIRRFAPPSPARGEGRIGRALPRDSFSLVGEGAGRRMRGRRCARARGLVRLPSVGGRLAEGNRHDFAGARDAIAEGLVDGVAAAVIQRPCAVVIDISLAVAPGRAEF